MATWLLVPSVVGLALTLNAWRPLHAPSPVALVSFFAGWLTTELALHHLAWQALFAAWAIHAGALTSPVGFASVLMTIASCIGLALLHRRASLARDAIDRALLDGIGRVADDARPSAGRFAVPFALGRREVETIRGVPFCRVGGVDLRLDVHRPRVRETGSRAPILVYVHGGGWVLGFRRFQGLPMMRELASRGWICFSIDYRLSPRATFPDHLVDVKRALAWVKEHAEEHGGDPEFVVLCGNSAGAHLASLTALTANEARYQPGFEWTDTRVAACVGLYGIYDFTDRHGHFKNPGLRTLLERAIMKATMDEDPEAYRDASPIERVHAGAPPFFVVHGDSDSLAPTGESRRFVAALRAHGVPVVYAEIPDAQHAFEVFNSPRAAHFVAGATSYLAHLHGGYVAARDAHEAELAARARSGFVPKGAPIDVDASEVEVEVA